MWKPKETSSMLGIQTTKNIAQTERRNKKFETNSISEVNGKLSSNVN